MIDLHTHTMHSDGADDVITLLKQAQKIGLEVLSITDHTSCKAYEEIENMEVSQYYTGKLVCGCELFTTIDGETIELLGYNIDTKIFNNELPKMYKYQLKNSNTWETEKLLEICKRLGVNIDYNNVKVNFDKEFGSHIIHKEMIKDINNKSFFENESAWESEYVFYRECMCNPDSEFFVDKSSLFPTPKEVVDLIKGAGGLVFIPHAFVYGKNSMKIFKELTENYDIDGIECYYTLFSDEQTQFLLQYCKEHNLYMSGGSDYHGANKPGTELGFGKGNLKIPYNITENWCKFI